MKDANGQALRIGDVVRVCGLPDLSEMPPHTRRESDRVFQYLVGRRKRIMRIDEVGNAEFMLRLKEKGKTTIHLVRIEPHLLKKPQRRKPPNQSA